MRAGFERAGDLEAARAVRAEMQAAGLAARKPSGPLPSYKAPAYQDAYGRRHGKQVVQGTQALGLQAPDTPRIRLRGSARLITNRLPKCVCTC